MKGRTQRQHVWWWLLMGVVALGAIATSASRPPTEGVSDDRMFHIAAQLKCVQCVGESVAGSSAPIAVEFRHQIREQMSAGRTNDEILDYFASRYDDVLLNPPTTGIGSLVWVAPVVLFVAGVVGLYVAMRRWSTRDGERTVTAEDEAIVAAALADDGD